MLLRTILTLGLLITTTGCTRLYYASMEKIGKEKREILVQRIIDSKKDQEAASKQIQTTMEAFQELTGFSGGNLEKTYQKLAGELGQSEDRAGKLQARIEGIEKVAGDLFREWEGEIGKMRDPALKTRSRAMLRETAKHYQVLDRKLLATHKRMEPVLQAFRDQVIFLKHNLNAKAITSLKKTSLEIDGDVSVLVKEIEASIQEADAFIATMEKAE
jgi:hypothetical protein